MGSRFVLMAVVFLAIGGAYWWFNVGPGRPQAAARSLSVEAAWPEVLRIIRPPIRRASQSLVQSGVPRAIAPLIVIAGLLGLGYMIAWVVLRIVTSAFTGATVVASVFQIVVAPLWQVGLTLVSAFQTVEWARDKGFVDADITTPAFVVFAIISLSMMYGLSKVRAARA